MRFPEKIGIHARRHGAHRLRLSYSGPGRLRGRLGARHASRVVEKMVGTASFTIAYEATAQTPQGRVHGDANDADRIPRGAEKLGPFGVAYGRCWMERKPLICNPSKYAGKPGRREWIQRPETHSLPFVTIHAFIAPTPMRCAHPSARHHVHGFHRT
jgi:hypothetical protein